MCSISDQPVPRPSSIRPPETWSAVVASLASTDGMAEARRRDHRAQPQRGRPRGERVDRPPGVERAALALPHDGDVVVRTEERLDPRALAGIGQRDPVLPGHILLAFDHQRDPHDRESYPLAPCRAPSSGLSTPPACSCGRARGSSSPSAWRTSRRSSAPGSASRSPASALLIGGRRAAPLAAHGLGAGGDRRRAPVRHDLRAHLLGRAVRDVGADRGAVRRDAALRGADRRRRAARRAAAAAAAARRRRSRSAGSRSRSARACTSARASTPCWPPSRSCCRRIGSAIGNVAIKQRGAKLDPLVMNGWAMLGGGLLLLAVSAPTEDWGATTWSATAIGSIVYLAAFGTGVHVRDADRADPRAADGHRVLHRDDHPVRRAGAWVRCSATRRSPRWPSAARCSWSPGSASRSSRSGAESPPDRMR